MNHIFHLVKRQVAHRFATRVPVIVVRLSGMRSRQLMLSLVVPVTALLLVGAQELRSGGTAASSDVVHVVVRLTAPPLAEPGASATALDAQQRRFADALAAEIPQARIHWRYRLVTNGVSVLLPAAELPLLGGLPGVAQAYEPTTYHVLGGPALGAIDVRSLPGYTPADAGAGLKIGIIDDGIDQTHPFFNPSGYTMPPGFPKGQSTFTTAKVIVARSFPPPGTTYAPARLAFDRGQSIHGTHVAGIAAGNANTPSPGLRLTGVAPRAYLGNYRALTIPTDADVGLDGNAPELVAAIEAAVADGMDVINLSLGEPEIEPSRDIVALALDAAADAGVVSTVAAGNDYGDFGAGTVTSPASAEQAIAVAASSDSTVPEIASFSSSGPTAVSLRLKPDVTAPGVGIVSSTPGGWSSFSGTSMAAPHVAGAAALLLQRHPDWTPAQVKTALMVTASRTTLDGRDAPLVRAGAGLIDVGAADAPLVTPSPASVSFGLLGRGETVTRMIQLGDAGGGPEPWVAKVEPPGVDATVTVEPVVAAPGALTLTVTIGTAAVDADLAGRVVLTRGDATRVIPFWGRIRTPALARAKRRLLLRPGVYSGNTRGLPSLVTRYRYPEVIARGAVTPMLRGPEQVFRVRVTKPIANFGVVVTSRTKGVDVEPRIVVAGDENRLAGYAALPFDLNPYLRQLGSATRSAGVIAPRPGLYDIVFDSRTPATAGKFTFRLWLDDSAPPTVRLLTPRVKRGGFIEVHVADAGSGIDAATTIARLRGRERTFGVFGNTLRIATADVPAGVAQLTVQVSDHQETRNMENVGPILPNTRVFRATVRIEQR
ncbi:MAG: S8 family serine peptidase [Gaiellales bacterium]